MKRTFHLLPMLIFSALIITGCANKNEKMEKQLKTFIVNWQAKVEPLQKEAFLAYWNASISGKDEDYSRSEQLQLQLNSIFTDKNDFAILKEIKESGTISDPLLKRQLEVLYNQYLGNQIDTALLARKIKLEVEIEKKFSNYRVVLDGKLLSDNDVEDILKTSKNSDELKTVWEGHKKIGSIVSGDIIQLVKIRNQIAKQLGFSNFHEMSLELGEQDPEEISELFDELDELTRQSFTGLKDEIDTYLANRLSISKDQLKPWHYQNRFFQEAPAIYSLDLDKYYKNQDIEKLTTDYYSGIGLDIKDIIANSDLYEKPGKNQHAYCIDIDNSGDVRVLCNIKPNYSWMNTMLHEFGHGVYDKYIDRSLPFSLRNPSHTFTTEAIAMLFGRLGANPQWMLDMGLIDTLEKVKIAEKSFKIQRLEQLTFSRWAQVMYRFEKGLYENPDQDLNKLWWDLVEKYQMIKRPTDRNEPDWASKIHIATFPCYYHNYLLGELLASQINHFITANIIKSDDFRFQSFYNNKEAGQYLVDRIFVPGASLNWNEMIINATGERLTAKYYADQFVK